MAATADDSDIDVHPGTAGMNSIRDQSVSDQSNRPHSSSMSEHPG